MPRRGTELQKVKIAMEILTVDKDFDRVLQLKICAVKGFLKNAGISESALATSEGIQCIAIGVDDLLNNAAGEVKFSPAFNLFAIQLKG